MPEPAKSVQPLLSALPDPLKATGHFLVWRGVRGSNGKTKKIPYYTNGKARKTDRLDTPEDLAALVSFDEAFDAFVMDDYSGIGVALVGEGIGAFDLDECLDDQGHLKRDHPGFTIAAQAKLAGAYMEISPSGRGLRIIGPCQSTEAYSKNGLEYWGARRFVTLTGCVYANAHGWVALDDLRALLGTRQDRAKPTTDDGDAIITPDTLADLADALEAMDSDERDLWIRVGHALKTLPEEKGWKLWRDWSAKSSKFNERDAQKTWDSFHPQSTSHKAVFAIAQSEWGWQNPKKGRKDPASAFQEADEDEGFAPIRRPRIIGIGDEQLHPTEFILDGFLPVGVSVIAGAWGAGKSTNLIPLMCSVAHLAPEEWGFWPALRRRILWVTEAPGQAHDTIYSLAKAEGSKPWSEYADWFRLCEAHRDPPKKLAKWLLSQIEDCAYSLPNGFRVHPVVVLDTTAANIDLENESDNSLVSQAMAILKQTLPNIPLILVGHTPKALARSDIKDMTFRGAGAWEADAVATYFLVHDDEVDLRFLAIRKSRFSPDYREISFDSDGGVKIIDTPWGQPQSKSYMHGVPRRSNGEERKALQAQLREERQEERRERTLTDRQARILAEVNKRTGDKLLTSKADIRKALGGKVELIIEAIQRLVESGHLVIHARPPMTGRGEAILPAGVDAGLFFAGLETAEE
jgi:hypothetical protein